MVKFGVGNVRELENFIERAVILSRGTELQLPIGELKQRSGSSAPGSIGRLEILEHAEKEHIVRALGETNWVIGGPAGAAARLGLKRTTLQSRMRKLGITSGKLIDPFIRKLSNRRRWL